MTVNIENEVGDVFDFDMDKVIKDAVTGCIEYMKFPYEAQVNVLVTSDAEIHRINLEQRQIDSPTDVLSFPMLEFSEPGAFGDINDEGQAGITDPDTDEVVLGDIVLSADRIKGQAAEYGHSQIRELSFLTVHSMLHLFGYDHMGDDEAVMMDLQRDILEKMGITR